MIATSDCTATYCWRKIASVSLLPMPGTPKIRSTTSAPPMSAPTLRPGDRQQREARRAQRVAESTRRVGMPLAFAVVMKSSCSVCDHVGAQQPHVDRDLADREADRRHQHVAPVVDRVERERRDVALGRQQLPFRAHVDREQQRERRRSGAPAARTSTVFEMPSKRRPRLVRGEDAERDRDEQREHLRVEHQLERHGQRASRRVAHRASTFGSVVACRSRR